MLLPPSIWAHRGSLPALLRNSAGTGARTHLVEYRLAAVCKMQQSGSWPAITTQGGHECEGHQRRKSMRSHASGGLSLASRPLQPESRRRLSGMAQTPMA